jgi:hypothetical protein
MYRVCVDGMRVSDSGRGSGSAELVRKGIPMTTSFVRVLEEVDSNEVAIRAGLRGSESSEGIGDRGAGALRNMPIVATCRSISLFAGSVAVR